MGPSIDLEKNKLRALLVEARDLLAHKGLLTRGHAKRIEDALGESVRHVALNEAAMAPAPLPVPQAAQCNFCHVDVLMSAYCLGCKSFVCDGCDKSGHIAGVHPVADHRRFG